MVPVKHGSKTHVTRDNPGPATGENDAYRPLTALRNARKTAIFRLRRGTRKMDVGKVSPYGEISLRSFEEERPRR